MDVRHGARNGTITVFNEVPVSVDALQKPIRNTRFTVFAPSSRYFGEIAPGGTVDQFEFQHPGWCFCCLQQCPNKSLDTTVAEDIEVCVLQMVVQILSQYGRICRGS